MKILIILISILFISSPAYAQGKSSGPKQDSYSKRQLTPAQLERVKVCKLILQDVDKKSLQQTNEELSRLSYPEENLQILEAMAKTYADIVREVKVEKQTQKEWLYSMIELNMGYLQLGGVKGGDGGQDEPLNRRIRYKLRTYLPSELLNHPALFHSLE